MRRRCVNDGPVTARVSSPLFFSTPFIRVQCVDDGNKSFISLYCNGFLSSHPTPPSTHNQLPVPVTSPYPPPPLSLLSSISLTSPELRGDPGQTSCRGNRQNSFFFLTEKSDAEQQEMYLTETKREDGVGSQGKGQPAEIH